MKPMEIVTDIENWHFKGEGVITIGTFDGVHIGHRKILNRLNEIKTDMNQKSIVFTFSPHPRKILFPEQTDLQILTTDNEKIQLIESLCIDVIVIFPFTIEFAQIEPLKFIKEILIEKMNMKKLVIGYDHRFGKDRRGDLSTFKTQADVFGYEVEEIPVQEINDLNVSSTRIRKALFEGDIKLANSNLGYNYSISGTVVKGKQLGRTIGYPTANLLIKDKDKLIPKIGVYFVEVVYNNSNYCGMMNIGTNPTTDNDNLLKLEVNIFNFDKDIYNEDLEIRFIERIRNEEKFNSIEELKNAIKSDEEKCKKLISILN